MTDKPDESEGVPPPYTPGVEVPPPYTPGADNLPQYHDLPPKKIDLPPYQDESYCNGYQDPSFLGSRCSDDRRRRFEMLSRADMILSIENLGTDSVFILCFLVCFLFNWVGYVICCCLFTSVAARCGAISGIGLNLVKILLILKRCSFDNQQMVQAQQYLDLHEVQYISLLAVGLLTMLFGVVRYNSAKSAINRQLLLPRYM